MRTGHAWEICQAPPVPVNETELHPRLEAVGSAQVEAPVQLALAADRRLEVDAAGLSFKLTAPDGNVELTVRVTAEGPVLTFAAASLEIAETKKLRIDVEELSVRARREASFECLGDLSQRVAGDSVSHCEGRVEIEAGSASITSHKGALTLDSTHDVAINGDRVLLNC